MSNAQEPAAQITNTLFPPPPEFYKQFTDEDVARYDALKENEAGPSRSPRAGAPGRVELGAEEREELEKLSTALEPPRSDWIEEEGRWVTFGEMHTLRAGNTQPGRPAFSSYHQEIKLVAHGMEGPIAEEQTRPHIPTPADIGLTSLLDPDESPQTALKPLLHSFLHTLLLLIDVLTGSARPPHELAEKGWGHEGDQYIQHMTNLAANMMVTANLHREVQAEATLVLLMEQQVETRRAQTEALRSKCRSISSKIQALKLDSRQVLGDDVGNDRQWL